MVSPHPSYPPYEMLASGLKTYTNTYDNKVKICSSKNLVMGSGSPQDIADFLEESTQALLAPLNYDSTVAADADFGQGLLMHEAIKLLKNKVIENLQ